MINKEKFIEVFGEELQRQYITKSWWEQEYVSPTLDVKPKTGHWIMPQQDDGMSDPIYYQVRCSECGFDLDPQTWHIELHQYGADKYCPKCGAVMAESEDQE